MTRNTGEQNQASENSQLPNLVTIVGRGVPSNFEIAVSGEIEMAAKDPNAETTVVSGGVAEGSIDVGVQRFRFSGQCANIRAVDWSGVEAPESSSTPAIHINYGVTER